MNTFPLLALFVAIEGGLIGGALVIMRRHQRDVHEAVHQMAVYVPTTTGSYAGGRTFSCPHMSIGNVVSAACGQCGPLVPT